ncbi:MAG TPA: hypothetical protein VIL85_15855 [Thermomicrobiales bacterium]|jgi:hypothetical protein
MGVDFEAIIGHSLSAADLPTLPARLNADATPDLARAVREFARAKNRRHAAWHQAHSSDEPFQPVAEEGDWVYQQPGYRIYYDSEGRECSPYFISSEQPLGADILKPASTVWQEMTVEEVWAKADGVEIEGPARLNLFVTRHCITLLGGTRWYAFLAEQDIQHPLRTVFASLGSLLGSPFVIYVPDSAYCPSIAFDVTGEDTIDEVSAYVRQHCGPPAPSLAELVKGHDGRPAADGYFIDDFADFSGAASQ